MQEGGGVRWPPDLRHAQRALMLYPEVHHQRRGNLHGLQLEMTTAAGCTLSQVTIAGR